MIRDADNVIPISMAVVLHIVLLGSMMVAFDFARTVPITPLAVRATLVTETATMPPPRVVEPEPVAEEPEPVIEEPEPVIEEPEPVIEEPEPVIEEPEPEPDNSDELRRQAEEEKLRQDALIEKERLEKIRQQEEAERLRQEQEALERKKREEQDKKERLEREEQEKERQRIAAEKKREDDIRRQREENERQRKEAESAARAEEIEAEENRMAAVDAGALAVYTAQIRQKIERNWSATASAGADFKCSVRVRQVPGGEVVGVSIISCNGDEAVQRSVEAAIYKSSPLPIPSDPSLFDRNILLNLSIRQ